MLAFCLKRPHRRRSGDLIAGNLLPCWVVYDSTELVEVSIDYYLPDGVPEIDWISISAP